MKKKLTAAAVAAGLLLLTGCAAQTVTPFTAYWQQNTSVYDRSFYETLHYSVSFDRSENFRSGFIFEPGEGCSYTVTTEAVPAWNGRSQLYRLTSSLTLEGSYIYVDPDTNEESEIVAFGGESGNEPAVIERTVLFCSPFGDNLEPVRSESTVYSYTPVEQDSREVAVYSYSYSVSYTEDGDEASVTYTDHFAGLTEAESTINENTRKVSVFAEEILPEGEVSVSGIQSRYTGIDEAQLLFAGRGLSYSSGSALPLTVVSGGSAYTVSMSGTAASVSCAGEMSFVLDGERMEDGAVEAVIVSARLAHGGTDTGPLQTAVYALPAQTDADGNAQGNLYFALPLEVRQAFGFAGTAAEIVYSLEEASHVLPAAAADGE